MKDNQVVTMLENVVLSEAGEVGPALDFGMFSKLGFNLLRHVAGAANSTIQIQHAAVLNESAWVDLGDPFDLAGTTALAVNETAFLRYIRFKVGTTEPSTARVSLYVVAKE